MEQEKFKSSGSKQEGAIPSSLQPQALADALCWPNLTGDAGRNTAEGSQHERHGRRGAGRRSLVTGYAAAYTPLHTRERSDKTRNILHTEEGVSPLPDNPDRQRPTFVVSPSAPSDLRKLRGDPSARPPSVQEFPASLAPRRLAGAWP